MYVYAGTYVHSREHVKRPRARTEICIGGWSNRACRWKENIIWFFARRSFYPVPGSCLPVVHCADWIMNRQNLAENAKIIGDRDCRIVRTKIREIETGTVSNFRDFAWIKQTIIRQIESFLRISTNNNIFQIVLVLWFFIYLFARDFNGIRLFIYEHEFERINFRSIISLFPTDMKVSDVCER